MNNTFGRVPQRPILSLKRSRVSAQALIDVAQDVLPSLGGDGLRVRLIDPLGGDPVISVEEDERRLRVNVSELAREMQRARIPDTRDAIAAALTNWIARRPVTDAQARNAGIAVLDWTDDTHRSIAWRVVVQRGTDLTVPWTPSPLSTAGDVHQIRSAATARSLMAPVTLHIEGNVALWMTPDNPMLATAALIDPDRMLGTMAAKGLTTRDVCMVIAPGRPVAAAEAPAAQRLAGETVEPHLTMSWKRISELGWK